MPFEKYRLVRATQNTLSGLYFLWRKEQAFRHELYACSILLPIICFMSLPGIIRLLLVLLLLLLLVVEALNSGLEAVVDRISLEIHEQSKIAKDIGSAAVGLTILMNIIAWIYVLYAY